MVFVQLVCPWSFFLRVMSKEGMKKGSTGAIIRWNKTHLGCFKRDPTVLESMLYCPQRIFATSIDQMGSMWGPFVLFWDDNYSNYPYGSQVVSVWDIWAPPSPDKSQMGPIFSATWVVDCSFATFLKGPFVLIFFHAGINL